MILTLEGYYRAKSIYLFGALTGVLCFVQIIPDNSLGEVLRSSHSWILVLSYGLEFSGFVFTIGI